jgi:hypothetical protein
MERPPDSRPPVAPPGVLLGQTFESLMEPQHAGSAEDARTLVTLARFDIHLMPGQEVTPELERLAEKLRRSEPEPDVDDSISTESCAVAWADAWADAPMVEGSDDEAPEPEPQGGPAPALLAPASAGGDSPSPFGALGAPPIYAAPRPRSSR